MLAFITQCSTTIFLYARRRNHAPQFITRVDQYVFELATAGILVGLLTLGTIAKVPLFKAPHGEHPLSISEETILFLGNRQEPKAISEKTDNTGLTVFRYAFIVLLCFYVLLAQGKFDLIGSTKMKWEDFDLPLRQKRSVADIEDLVLFYTAIFGPMIGAAWAAYVTQTRGSPKRLVCCSELAYLALLPFAVGLGLVLLFSLLGCVAVVPIGVREYTRLFSQVVGFQTWP